jgi:hypothetical protein
MLGRGTICCGAARSRLITLLLALIDAPALEQGVTPPHGDVLPGTTQVSVAVTG